MRLIIDANNLAGKLGLLGSSNFDQTLLTLVRASNRGKGREVWLVFDGIDAHGDRHLAGDNVTLFRASRGTQSADDKIVELTAWLASQARRGEYNDEVTVVTDDTALIAALEPYKESFHPGKFRFERASDFAVRLRERKPRVTHQQPRPEEPDDRDLPPGAVDEINEELKRRWT